MIEDAATRRVALVSKQAHHAGERCGNRRSAALLLYDRAKRPAMDLQVFGRPGGLGLHSSTVWPLGFAALAVLFWLPGMLPPSFTSPPVLAIARPASAIALALAAGLFLVRCLIAAELRRRYRAAQMTGLPDPADHAAVASLTGLR